MIETVFLDILANALSIFCDSIQSVIGITKTWKMQGKEWKNPKAPSLGSIWNALMDTDSMYKLSYNKTPTATEIP